MIRTVSFEPPALDEREILRYARVRENTDEIAALLRACIAEAEPVLRYQACYTVVEVNREGESFSFGGVTVASDTVKRTLDGCDRAVLFAVTVGAPFDRLIARYSRLSPAKAVFLHAIGAERAEALCDALCASVADEYQVSLMPRVSPGYGDFALERQRDFFSLLDCPRRIGLTLNESLLMSPSKSVTALAGFKRQRL